MRAVTSTSFMESRMSAIFPSLERSTLLRRVLLVDAASCVGMGLFLTLLAVPLAPLLGLPQELLLYAGLALLPTAGFMAWVGTREPVPPAGAWLVIVGNLLWVAASLFLLVLVSATALGYAFVIGQAIVVGVLAELEYLALRRYG
jgi:hypothetical protein